MNKVTLTAATIAFGAFLATIPAQAEYGGGGVQKRGDQCFVPAQGQARDGFGAWVPCAQAGNMRNGIPVPAAAPASASLTPANPHSGQTRHRAQASR
jgi:hypothetical protein